MATQPTIATTSSVTWDAANSAVINVPASTADGDLLIMVVTNYNTSMTSPAANNEQVSAGWLCLGQTNNAGAVVAVFRREARSEPASYTVTFAGSCNGNIFMLRITGHDPYAPIGYYVAGTGLNTASYREPNATDLVLEAWVGTSTSGAATLTPADSVALTAANSTNVFVLSRVATYSPAQAETVVRSATTSGSVSVASFIVSIRPPIDDFAAETLVVADSFNRADVASPPGATSTGGITPSVSAGAAGIQSGMLYSSTTAGEQYVIWNPGQSDIDVVWSLPYRSGDFGFIFNYLDASNFLFVTNNVSDGSLVYRRTGGSYFAIWAPNTIVEADGVNARRWRVGDRFRLLKRGSNIRLYVNEVVQFHMDVTGMVVGNSLGFRFNSDGNSRLEGFAAATPPALTTSVAGTVDTTTIANGDTSAESTGFVYKGRDSATSDSGSVA